MSELAQIQKALEDSQKNMQQLFDAQKQEIATTGVISKQLQEDLAKVNEEMQKSGARLFDLEQKLSAGAEDPAQKNHSLSVHPKSLSSPGTAAKVASMLKPSINRWAAMQVLLAL